PLSGRTEIATGLPTARIGLIGSISNVYCPAGRIVVPNLVSLLNVNVASPHPALPLELPRPHRSIPVPASPAILRRLLMHSSAFQLPPYELSSSVLGSLRPSAFFHCFTSSDRRTHVRPIRRGYGRNFSVRFSICFTQSASSTSQTDTAVSNTKNFPQSSINLISFILKQQDPRCYSQTKMIGTYSDPDTRTATQPKQPNYEACASTIEYGLEVGTTRESLHPLSPNNCPNSSGVRSLPPVSTIILMSRWLPK